MENAIERAMDARRAAQRSGAFNSRNGEAGSPGSPESQRPSSDELAEAQAHAHIEAESQRTALEIARQKSTQSTSLAPEGMTALASATAQAGKDSSQLDDYLEAIARDRKAISAMEADLNARDEISRGNSTEDGGAAKDLPAQALEQSMSSLAGPMAETQSRYLDVLMDSCKSLPALVVNEIRTEVAGLLDAKIKGKLNELEQAAKSPATVAAPIGIDNPTSAQLAGGLAHLISLGPGPDKDEASSKLALSLIKSADVRQEIEPMVALLVTYAQARLNENAAQ